MCVCRNTCIWIEKEREISMFTGLWWSLTLATIYTLLWSIYLLPPFRKYLTSIHPLSGMNPMPPPPPPPPPISGMYLISPHFHFQESILFPPFLPSPFGEVSYLSIPPVTFKVCIVSLHPLLLERYYISLSLPSPFRKVYYFFTLLFFGEFTYFFTPLPLSGKYMISPPLSF